MRLRTAGIGVIVVVAAALLAVTDYWFKERTQQIAQEPQDVQEPQVPTPATGTGMLRTGSGATSPIPRVVKKGASLKKYTGPVIENVLATLQLIPVETSEASLLQLIAPEGLSVRTNVLLLNNDRAALFSWTESDDVKTLFSALKQALQEQFSPKVQDLIDETRTQENGPPVDILSFFDPAISAEKVVFLRVRTRLYELHFAKEKEGMMNRLIAELSR
ncbi:MAG: hypothetical protein WC840_04510 [Candidatus Peribacteraceae bacterium]